MYALNLKDKRFGKLVVIKDSTQRKWGQVVWECKCDCGNTTFVPGNNLRKGNTESCGCLKGNKKDLRNRTFGRLTIIEDVGRTSKGSILWKCICICGGEIIVPSIRLLQGQTKSCGCLRKLPKGQAAFNELFSSYKKRAKKRKLTFELTEKEFKLLTQSACFFCNQLPNNIVTAQGINGSYKYNGIDRINNKTGYTKANCVPCCKVCNTAKMELTIDQFVNWVNRISKNYNKIKYSMYAKFTDTLNKPIMWVGLDLSLTETGICAIDDNLDIKHISVIPTKDMRGLQRPAYISDKIIHILNEYNKYNITICVEGYSYGSKGRAVINLGELHGIVKLALYEANYIVTEIPPTTLKLFITGKGNANKNIVLEKVYRKYSIGSEQLLNGNDNAVDAFALARFGYAYFSWYNTNNENYTDYELRAFKGLKAKCTL